MNKLKDKVAIITGAGSGQGRATALLFAKEGAKVVVATYTSSHGEETMRKIKNVGGEGLFVKTDVSKADEAENMVLKTVDNYGRVDILFNNAGIWVPCNILDETMEGWNKTIAVNLTGVFLCSKYSIREMAKTRGGVIINNSSTAGVAGYPDHAAYCASKGGVVLMTKALAIECASKNIRVNCICPGSIDTPMAQNFIKASENPEKVQEAFERMAPISRFGKPEEISYLALYLASDESSFVTGSIFLIDGGHTAGPITDMRAF